MLTIWQTITRLALATMLLACSSMLAACGGGDPDNADDPDVPTPSICQAQPRPPKCL